MTQDSKLSQSFSVNTENSQKHLEELFDKYKQQIVDKVSDLLVQSRMNMNDSNFSIEKSQSRDLGLNHCSRFLDTESKSIYEERQSYKTLHEFKKMYWSNSLMLFFFPIESSMNLSDLQKNQSRINYNHILELSINNIDLSCTRTLKQKINSFKSNQNQEKSDNRDQTDKININTNNSRKSRQLSRTIPNVEYVNQPNQPSLLNVQNISCQQSILLSNQVQQLQQISDQISCQPSSYMLSSQNPLGYDEQTILRQGNYLSQQDQMNYVQFEIDLGINQKQRNQNQALEHFDQALQKIVRYHGGSSNQKYVICLKQKINCLRNLKRYSEALECCQQYVEVAKKMYQSDSIKMKDALKCQDEILVQQQKLRVSQLQVYETLGFLADDRIKSLEFYKLAYKTLIKSPNTQSENYLYRYEKAVCNYIRALIANYEISKACKLFSKANNFFLQKKGDSPLLCFRILFANALLFGNNCDLSNCIKYSDMALSILEQGFKKFDGPMNNNQGQKKQFIRYLHQLLEMKQLKELINKHKHQNKMNKEQDTIKLLVHEEFLIQIKSISQLSYSQSQQQSFFNLIGRLQNSIPMIQVYHQKFCKEEHQGFEESN